MRSYRFWYHYNKPLTKTVGRTVMTVHFRDECINAEHIICNVPTETHRRRSQPQLVVRGWAEKVRGFYPDSGEYVLEIG